MGIRPKTATPARSAGAKEAYGCGFHSVDCFWWEAAR